MQFPRNDSLATLTGKLRQKGDKIKLKPEYSKADKSYGLERTFVFNIEGDRLIWNSKPIENKRKVERKMSKVVGEKVIITVISPEPLILNKEN